MILQNKKVKRIFRFLSKVPISLSIFAFLENHYYLLEIEKKTWMHSREDRQQEEDTVSINLILNPFTRKFSHKNNTHNKILINSPLLHGLKFFESALLLIWLN